jgi:hypothetical protein
MSPSQKPNPPDASTKRYTLEQLPSMPAEERVRYLESLPHKEFGALITKSLVEGLNAKARQDNPD